MHEAKSITTRGNEAIAYERLRAWAACEDAARFILALLAQLSYGFLMRWSVALRLKLSG